MNWIPKNIKTGTVYPPVTDAEKKAMQSYYMTKGKFTFSPVSETTPKPKKEKAAPEPIEAKKADDNPAELPE